MKSSHTSLVFFICIAGVGLALLPAGRAQSMRNIVRDALWPGQQMAQIAINSGRDWSVDRRKRRRLANEIVDLKSRIRTLELAERRLKFQVALTRDRQREWEQTTALPLPVQPSEPLLDAELLEARVVGRGTGATGNRQPLLIAGATAGIDAAALVLDGREPLLDLGTENGVVADSPVYAGRTVVGRIAAVGRWTSTVRLITDVDYSGPAQLARLSGDELFFGPEGILQGDGNGSCRLDFVSRDEAVREGDYVLTGTDGAQPLPMFYGKVVKVTGRPGALHWNIQVQPVVDVEKLRSVYVLKSRLNRLRILAQ